MAALVFSAGITEYLRMDQGRYEDMTIWIPHKPSLKSTPSEIVNFRLHKALNWDTGVKVKSGWGCRQNRNNEPGSDVTA